MMTRSPCRSGPLRPGRAVAPGRRQLSDRLAALLVRQIEHGALRPGDRLPSEQQLALAHGVSRTVVREAVHQLKSRQLLHSRQGAGVFVAEAPAQHGLAFDASVLRSIDAVVQVREVRRALEGETAASPRSARRRRRSPNCAVRSRRSTAARRAGGDGVGRGPRLPPALTGAAGNPHHFGRLPEFLEPVHDRGDARHARQRGTAGGLHGAGARRHAAIVEAVAAHRPALARRRAVEHMRRGDRRLQIAGLIAAPPSARNRARTRGNQHEDSRHRRAGFIGAGL